MGASQASAQSSLGTYFTIHHALIYNLAHLVHRRCEMHRLLLFIVQVHICSHRDDQSGTKVLGVSGGAYMLVILSIPIE